MSEKKIIDAEIVSYDVAVLNNKVDIVSKVDQIAAEIQRKVDALDLEQLEATEENKKKITALRTELNADLNRYAEEVKLISKIVNEPVDLLREQIKSKVNTIIKEKVDLLKEKLDAITQIQLEKNKTYALNYYQAKYKSQPLRVGVEINDIPWSYSFNSSMKSIRDTVDIHFESVSKALTIIDSHQYKEQLEALWIKNKFDLGQALIELQSQLVLAENLMKQKAAAIEAEEKRLAKIAEEQATKEAEENRIVIDKRSINVVEPIETYIFELNITDSELERIIDFFENEDVDYSVL